LEPLDFLGRLVEWQTIDIKNEKKRYLSEFVVLRLFHLVVDQSTLNPDG
jgi:hypothetical protein